jgi:hypothetical protein
MYGSIEGKKRIDWRKKNWVTKANCCYKKGRIFFFQGGVKNYLHNSSQFYLKNKKKKREKEKGEFFLFSCQKEKKNLCSILFPSSLFLHSLTRHYRHVLCSVYQSVYVWFLLLLFFFPIFLDSILNITSTNNNLLSSCLNVLENSLCQLFSFFLTKKNRHTQWFYSFYVMEFILSTIFIHNIQHFIQFIITIITRNILFYYYYYLIFINKKTLSFCQIFWQEYF